MTTREEHFGLLGPAARERRPRRRRRRRAGGDPRGGDAADAPARALAGALDDRPRAAGAGAARADRRARPRRRRAVGRRDPGRRGRARLPDHLRPEVALRPGRDRRARRRRSGAAARRPAELLLADRLRGDAAASSRPPERRASTPAGSRPRASPGSSTALELPPEWRFERAAEQTARCRELLAPLVDVVPGDATLVAFRAEDPPALVATLFDAGVVVRDLPARASSASRAAGGRATTTSPGSSRPCNSLSELGGVRRRRQAELLRDRLQRGDDVRDVLVELDADQLGARVDLVAVDSGRERRLLQLLLDRLRLQALEAGRADEPARVHEARELVAGEERLLQRRVARHRQVLRVGEDRLDHLLGIALLAQDRRAVLRVLVERGVDLVVEVVQERRDAPELLVLAEAARVRARRRLDGERVPAAATRSSCSASASPRPCRASLHGRLRYPASAWRLRSPPECRPS